jgi:hypothetical protein
MASHGPLHLGADKAAVAAGHDAAEELDFVLGTAVTESTVSEECLEEFSEDMVMRPGC